jgi:hypothetical protein
MRRYLLCAGMALAASLGLGHAQTLAEMQLVVAASAQLNPALRLPSGSYRALGDTQAFVSRVPGAAAFTDWEVYAATGLAARLQPAFVQQLATSFAVSGYFLEEQQEQAHGDETHTRYLFADDAGARVLLYTIRRPDDLIYLIARAR